MSEEDNSKEETQSSSFMQEEKTAKSTQENEIQQEEGINYSSTTPNAAPSASSSSSSSNSSSKSSTAFNKWWRNTGADLVEKGFSKNTIIVRAANDLSSLTDVEHSSIMRALNKDISNMSTHDVCKEVSKL